ncbi:MAG: hypothetical protein AAF585_28580 [Verrucomicrobiota bacterium]
MNPHRLTFSIIGVYCVSLWVTNWSWVREYDRETGVTGFVIDLRGTGAVVGFLCSIFLIRRVWQVMRLILDAGARIPSSERLWGRWRYLLLLFPLAWQADYASSGQSKDGADFQSVVEYGGGPSGASILLSAIAIMLFQFLVRLESFNPENQ